jgi:MoxR-like ATPase
MLKVLVGYPDFGEELTIVHRALADPPTVRTILSAERLHEFQGALDGVYVDRLVAEYAVALAMATRQPAAYGLEEIAPYIAWGASPRGSINLVRGARALALLRGRGYALPQDVADLAPDVLRHRIVLSYAALADEVTADNLLGRVLGAIPAPPINLSAQTA